MLFLQSQLDQVSLYESFFSGSIHTCVSFWSDTK